MKAGLFLALWEVTTHVSLGGYLHILAGPTSGKQMESECRAALPWKKFCSFTKWIFNILLQRVLGHGILGMLASLIMIIDNECMSWKPTQTPSVARFCIQAHSELKFGESMYFQMNVLTLYQSETCSWTVPYLYFGMHGSPSTQDALLGICWWSYNLMVMPRHSLQKETQFKGWVKCWGEDAWVRDWL